MSKQPIATPSKNVLQCITSGKISASKRSALTCPNHMTNSVQYIYQSELIPNFTQTLKLHSYSLSMPMEASFKFSQNTCVLSPRKVCDTKIACVFVRENFRFFGLSSVADLGGGFGGSEPPPPLSSEIINSYCRLALTIHIFFFAKKKKKKKNAICSCTQTQTPFTKSLAPSLILT